MLELICVGDELLDGRTRDANAHWLGQQLGRVGRSLDRFTVVGDEPGHIVAALDAASERARHVLVSGGLGPTDDDRTRAAAAAWRGVDLVEHEDVLVALRERFARAGRPFASTNARQAKFPEGALVLPTEVGTAAGFRLTPGRRTIDFVPGVPREFRWFVQRHWLPLVLEQASSTAQRRWRFFGIGESEVGARVEGLDGGQAIDPGGAKLHYTARFPEVHLFARATGRDAQETLGRVDAEVRRRFDDVLIGEGEASLAERLGEALLRRAWRITTAESCTGGQLAQTITSSAGSSAYFDEAVVTYSNEAKIERLGVSPDILAVHGAVSPQTAVAMARGARARAAADVALAVTGIAGPSGGTDEKPVGTVDIALAVEGATYHRRFAFLTRSRGQVRTLSTWAALTAALWLMEGRLPSEWKRFD